MTAFTLHNNLTSVFWPTRQKTLREIGVVIAASLVIALASQVTIPLIPVPITLQSFAVIVVGSTLGWRLGLFAVLLYLAEGALGLPVFAGWSFGLPTFMGPTAGYLIGFIPAVVVSGFLLEKGMARSKLTAFVAALLGDACILALGALFLATFIGIKQALLVGVMPFALVELVKLAVLSFVIPKCWR